MKIDKNNILRKESWLTGNMGNNSFSYDERSVNKNPEIFLPSLVQGSLEDLEVGTDIVFEEYDKKVLPYNGLQKHLLMQIQIEERVIPVYIFDNHNWAFLYWWEYMQSTGKFGMDVVHIDQHSDMRTCESLYSGDIISANIAEILQYTTNTLNVGNFIIPALESGLINSVRQITGSLREGDCIYNWEDGLQKLDIGGSPKSYILDIDIDYFAREMKYFSEQEKHDIVSHWIQNTSCITIATSPFFIEQDIAIELIREILSPYLVSE